MKSKIIILLCLSVLSCNVGWSKKLQQPGRKIKKIAQNIDRAIVKKDVQTAARTENVVRKIVNRDIVRENDKVANDTLKKQHTKVPENASRSRDGIRSTSRRKENSKSASRSRDGIRSTSRRKENSKFASRSRNGIRSTSRRKENSKSASRSRNGIRSTSRRKENSKSASRSRNGRRSTSSLRENFKSAFTGWKSPCDRKTCLSRLTKLAEKIRLPKRTNRLGVRFADKSLSGAYKLRLNQLWRGIEVYDSGIVVKQRSTGDFEKEALDGNILPDIDRHIRSPKPNLTEQKAKRIAVQTNGDSSNNVRNIRVSLTVTTQRGKPTLTYLVNYLANTRTGYLYSKDRETHRPTRRTDSCRRIKGPQEGADQSEIYTEEEIFKKLDGFEESQTVEIVDRVVCRQSGNNRSKDITTVKLDDTSLKRPFTFIDANNGTVYQTWDGLAHAYSKQNLIAGNPSSNISTYKMFVATDSSRTNCFYQFPLGGNKYLRLNDHKDASKTKKTQFECSSAKSLNYDPTNGETSPRNSAYIWSYYTLLFLRRLGDKILRDVNIEVHHGGMHSFWTGSALEFGDGKGGIFPLTSPDIVAHEVAHQFTESYSQLEYRKQSGAINEAFSDITAVAFMDHQFSIQDFKVGQFTNDNRVPFRDICSPKSTATLTYSSDEPMREHLREWTPSDDVHRASGIYSKAFCLLSKTNGWTIQLAYKAFFDANRYYWRKQETFNGGACGVREAAKDLLGDNPQAVKDVDRAFGRVGVKCSQE